MATQSDILTFNVQTKDVFILVSGTTSITNPKKYTIIPNDVYIYPNSGDIVENLDPQFTESNFDGQEELPVLFNGEIIPQEAAIQLINESNKNRQDVNVMSGGGSVIGVIGIQTTPRSPGWGKLKSGLTDENLLTLMVDYIEGGYYHQSHAKGLNNNSQYIMKDSGETLWGVDRCAGNTEGLQHNSTKNTLGIKFWSTIDKISGYGGYADFSRSIKTSAWNYDAHPVIQKGWPRLYLPTKRNTNTNDYNIMLSTFTQYALSQMNSMLNSNFNSYKDLKSLILNDSRLKFLWLRATWNGTGWFSKFASNKTGVIWAYHNGYNTPDSLIIWDLNHRLSFHNDLITHDVKRIAELLGVTNTQAI